MRFWLWIFFLLLPCMQAQAQGIASVTVKIVPEGIEARVRLSTPTKTFELADRDIARDGQFEVQTPNISYANDRFTSEQPFRQLTLIVRHTTQEFDGKYAPVRPFGEGRVFHTDTLVGKRAQWRMRYRYDLPRGYVSTAKAHLEQNGNVFIGPRSYVTDKGSFVVVVAPRTPQFLQDMVVADFGNSLSTYTRLLGQTLPEKPIAIIQTNTNGRGFTGDMAPGPTAYVRFNGPGWDKPDPSSRAWVQSFVSHEVFHFWNGGLVSSEGEATWLHEGAAEYAAILTTAQASGDMDQAMTTALRQRLEWCGSGLSQLNDPALDRLAFLPSQVRYPCGVVMMWAADLHVQRESGGQRTFFDMWADLTKLALTRRGRNYSVDDFTKLVDPKTSKSVEAIRLLREESGRARFGKLLDALRVAGATITSAPTAETRREGILVHLMGVHCSGVQYGFSITGATLSLDTKDGCGVLSGNPVITSIESSDPARLSAETYANMQAKCRAGESVRLGLIDNRTLDVPCREPLPDAALASVVTKWRP